MSTASSGNTTSLSTQANLPLQNGLFLYAHPDAHHSHRVRLALAEKDIEYTLILVDPDDRPEDLAALNPITHCPLWLNANYACLKVVSF